MKQFTSKNQKIGEIGESLSCKFLVKHGFSIIERNYTRKWGEIDIVAQKDKKLYFIEVKTVSCETVDLIEKDPKHMKVIQNVHGKKVSRMKRVIQTYLIEHNVSHETRWQFDIIAVHLERTLDRAKVTRLRDIIL
jgi:putative endonuclease